MPNVRWLLRLITAVHRRVYLASGGRLGARAGRFHFLLLLHTGRRSGRARAVPLLAFEDAGRWVVVASNAGDHRPPAWWRNLQTCPRAAIRVGRERVAVEAREADREERRRLWPRFVSAYRWFEDYERRAGRPIPVVILDPV
jgi:deazaflavin-dependent oxidoreductase (nitroreductase family)